MKILVLLLALLTVSECEKNVTGQTGQNITLPCKYDIKINGPAYVCWGRGPLPFLDCSNQLLATDRHKVIKESRASSRYQLQGRLDEGDVSLTIMNVTEEDTGLYGCRVEISGWFNDEKHPVHLTVNRAPRLISTPSSGTTSSSSDTHQTTAATPTSGVATANKLHGKLGNVLRRMPFLTQPSQTGLGTGTEVEKGIGSSPESNPGCTDGRRRKPARAKPAPNLKMRMDFPNF